MIMTIIIKTFYVTRFHLSVFPCLRVCKVIFASAVVGYVSIMVIEDVLWHFLSLIFLFYYASSDPRSKETSVGFVGWSCVTWRSEFNEGIGSPLKQERN